MNKFITSIIGLWLLTTLPACTGSRRQTPDADRESATEVAAEVELVPNTNDYMPPSSSRASSSVRAVNEIIGVYERARAEASIAQSVQQLGDLTHSVKERCQVIARRYPDVVDADVPDHLKSKATRVQRDYYDAVDRRMQQLTGGHTGVWE